MNKVKGRSNSSTQTSDQQYGKWNIHGLCVSGQGTVLEFSNIGTEILYFFLPGDQPGKLHDHYKKQCKQKLLDAECQGTSEIIPELGKQHTHKSKDQEGLQLGGNTGNNTDPESRMSAFPGTDQKTPIRKANRALAATLRRKLPMGKSLEIGEKALSIPET